jgi:hypothetical protein
MLKQYEFQNIYKILIHNNRSLHMSSCHPLYYPKLLFNGLHELQSASKTFGQLHGFISPEEEGGLGHQLTASLHSCQFIAVHELSEFFP